MVDCRSGEFYVPIPAQNPQRSPQNEVQSQSIRGEGEGKKYSLCKISNFPPYN